MSTDPKNPRVTHQQPRSDEPPDEAKRLQEEAERERDLNDPDRRIEQSERERTGQDE